MPLSESFEGPDSLDPRIMYVPLYRVARELLEIEFRLYKTQSGTDNYDIPATDSRVAEWLPRSRDIVRRVLEEVSSLAYEEQPTLSARMNVTQNRRTQSRLTREQIFDQNLSPSRANATFDRMLQVLLPSDPSSH